MPVIYMDRASIESLTEKDIREIIDENSTDVKYGMLHDYYVGNHRILGENKKDSTAPNNRLVNNMAKYITDTATGYFVGEPIVYDSQNDEYLQTVQDIFDYNDEQDHNMELAKQCSICGSCFEMLYLDEDAKIRLARVPAANGIMICETDSGFSTPMAFIRTIISTIVPGICTELGIESGTMAATGVNISSMPCFGKKAYEAIMMAYTAAAKQNGSKYIPLMTNINKVSVLEKGTLCGAVMTGDYNLIEATYKSTLQKLVNRVLITDKNNNVIKTVEDAASIQKYGLVQRVLKQNDGEDATTQAKKMLVTVESSATVSGVPNDFRAVSGYSIIVQETDTGLYGQFYIESDTHTFSCGKAQMDLTLAFENLMDEREIEETA